MRGHSERGSNWSDGTTGQAGATGQSNQIRTWIIHFLYYILRQEAVINNQRSDIIIPAFFIFMTQNRLKALSLFHCAGILEYYLSVKLVLGASTIRNFQRINRLEV